MSDTALTTRVTEETFRRLKLEGRHTRTNHSRDRRNGSSKLPNRTGRIDLDV